MSKKKVSAIAYYRTSSAANCGPEKDSHKRQSEAVLAYARARYDVVASFQALLVVVAIPVIVQRSGLI